MKIYVLLGHPDSESLDAQIAVSYCTKSIDQGHDVRYQKLGDMNFDPILWKGYHAVQDLEPDLQLAQENILWCEKWVIVYPVWWGNVPALLKGFLDRTVLPGFAFKYHEKDPFWDMLLKGRSAELITTSDAPAIWLWWQYGNSDVKAMKNAVLEFCGIRPVKVKRISSVRYLNEAQRKQKLLEIAGR